MGRQLYRVRDNDRAYEHGFYLPRQGQGFSR